MHLRAREYEPLNRVASRAALPLTLGLHIMWKMIAHPLQRRERQQFSDVFAASLQNGKTDRGGEVALRARAHDEIASVGL